MKFLARQSRNQRSNYNITAETLRSQSWECFFIKNIFLRALCVSAVQSPIPTSHKNLKTYTFEVRSEILPKAFRITRP